MGRKRREVRVAGQRVVVHPLAEVVGQVEAAVVVATVLVVDEREPRRPAVGARVVAEDVPLLTVVVTEPHRRGDLAEVTPGKS